MRNPNPSPGVREVAQGSQSMYVCTVQEQTVTEQQGAGREMRYRMCSGELRCCVWWSGGPRQQAWATALLESHEDEATSNSCMQNLVGWLYPSSTGRDSKPSMAGLGFRFLALKTTNVRLLALKTNVWIDKCIDRYLLYIYYIENKS